jgi:hypothetical protein
MTMPRTTLAALSTAALLAVGTPAYASHGGGDHDGVSRSGSCSDGSRWELKVKSDDNRLEVEGEVDSNRSGQAWAWRIKDNGAAAAKGRATTGGRSGSFSVERKVADKAGTDQITFRATYAGEVCTGTVTF